MIKNKTPHIHILPCQPFKAMTFEFWNKVRAGLQENIMEFVAKNYFFGVFIARKSKDIRAFIII